MPLTLKVLPRQKAGMVQPAPHRVAVLALEGVVAFDLCIPLTVFGALMTDGQNRRMYDVFVCGSTSDVCTLDGFSISTQRGMRALTNADTVVVPGWRDFGAPLDRSVSNAIRRASDRGARVVSICTGAFALANAGLLAGKRATTHWSAAPQLAAMYPDVDVEPDALYVDEGNICTSAGMAAGIDLCLYLVRKDFGNEVANSIARTMVTAPHRTGGQLQFAEPSTAISTGSLEDTREWMLANIAKPMTVDMLAKRAGLSRRSFDRRFLEQTETTPLQWLLDHRVALARRMLETTDRAVEDIAVHSGFGTSLSLRKHFRRIVGTMPLSYRNTFRQKR